MRNLIMFNMMSLDGYFEGPDHSLDWHNVDDEFNEFAIEQLLTANMLLFGRVTYEMMASFWPSEFARTTDPVVAALMNGLPKVVFSNTLKKAEWNNTRLIGGDAVAEAAKLKREPGVGEFRLWNADLAAVTRGGQQADILGPGRKLGEDLFLFGSARLGAALTQRGLIDEYRIMVNPVILGRGVPLFKESEDKTSLQLHDVRTFRNGNVLLYYRRGGG